jgi:predicted ATPase
VLDSLLLRNFKSARHLDVPLSKLTVLSGLNGSGKSTVLQAIGLLRQSLQISNSNKHFKESFSVSHACSMPSEDGSPDYGVTSRGALTSQRTEKLSSLHLRGPLVQLGMASDVLSQRASEYEIQIGLSLKTSVSGWVFTANVDKEHMDEDTLPEKRPHNQDASGVSGEFMSLDTEASPAQSHLRDCRFQFLQADRLTPRTHYERSDTADRNLGFLGAHGQYTPDFLADQGDTLEVSAKRRCPATATGVATSLMDRIAATPKLYDQVNGWLQHLSPGVRLSAERIKLTDLVTLGFSYASTELAQDSDRRRPANVGFGLTYSLPIVTACLSAPAGSLLLLENPEAHLHPRGQAALGTLLAKCAGDGVQILVETHSDHILNGIRLAVKHGAISNTDVRLCHFTRDTGTGDSYIETPMVLPNGELSSWPEGFFDEWERSLEELLK